MKTVPILACPEPIRVTIHLLLKQFPSEILEFFE